MTVTLVDSNVLIDVATADPDWLGWSAAKLAAAADAGALVINPLVFAEVSIAYASIEALDAALPQTLYRRESLPWEAAFLAGKAFVAYRRRGGSRSAALPDFYIGAHAAVRSYRLLTRDARRFRTYYPRLALVAPEG